MPDAAVQWNLYGLKPIVLFRRCLKERRPAGIFAVTPWTNERTIDSPGLVGRENRNCFFTKFVVKRHAYGAKANGAFHGHPRTLSGLAVFFLLLAAFLAVLNGQKVKALRATSVTPHASVPAKVNAPTDGTTAAQQQGKTADTEDRVAKAEAALAQADREKSDLKNSHPFSFR